FLDFLFDGLQLEHITTERLSPLDASEIIESLVQKLGLNFSDYIAQYAKLSFEQGRLAEVFPDKIIAVIDTASEKVTAVHIEQTAQA
nr:hypothetical protein [Blastocatellia bacterium]